MEFAILLLNGITWIVLADAISSWFAKPDQFPRTITGLITAPLYRPVHALLKPSATGGMDLSPLIVIMVLQGAARLIPQLALA